jgi:hypothetical protein
MAVVRHDPRPVNFIPTTQTSQAEQTRPVGNQEPVHVDDAAVADVVARQTRNRFAVTGEDASRVEDIAGSAAVRNAPVFANAISRNTAAQAEMDAAVTASREYTRTQDSGYVTTAVTHMGKAAQLAGLNGADPAIAVMVMNLLAKQEAQESRGATEDAQSIKERMLSYKSSSSLEAAQSALAAQRSVLQRAGVRLNPNQINGKDGATLPAQLMTEHAIMDKEKLEKMRADLQRHEMAESKELASMSLDRGPQSVEQLDRQAAQLNLLQALIDANDKRVEAEKEHDIRRQQKLVQ